MKVVRQQGSAQQVTKVLIVQKNSAHRHTTENVLQTVCKIYILLLRFKG